MRRLCLLSSVVLALLVPASAQAAPTPLFSESTSLSGDPQDVVTGPDGALWFTARGANGVGRLTADGLTETWFTVGVKPNGIVAGPDGNVWFADTGNPGQVWSVSVGGSTTPNATGGDTQPTGIVVGPDDALWFTEAKSDKIGRVTTGATPTVSHPSTLPGSGPYGITVGPDGALWFTAESSGAIGRLPTDGSPATMYPLPSGTSQPRGIVAGPDGALWFTEFGAGKIGRMSTGGSLVEYSLGGGAQPSDIVVGSDGSLWFTDFKDPGRIGRITTDGDLVVWPITPATNSHPLGLAVGPDGALWFAQSSNPKLGRVTTGPGAQSLPVTDATDSTATLRGVVMPVSQATTYYFEYGPTTAYGSVTTAAAAGQGGGAVSVEVPVAGLAAGTTYHYRVVAVNGTDTTRGPDRTFATGTTPADAPALDQAPTTQAPDPTPVLGRSIVAGAAKGVVKVKLKGTNTFVPLTAKVSVPTGSELDTTNGSVTLVSALDTRGHAQTGTFNGGRFKVKQSKTGKGMTDLYLSGPQPGRCTAPNRASASTVAKKRKRSLWGKDNRGRFRTHGADSVATVRGTRWLTQDRCDGTLTRVTQGSVVVRDLHRKRSKVVRAGQSYLARRK
jgi:virginiamycin B lyase